MGPRSEASSFDPCLHFVYRKSGPAIGAPTTYIDGILGRGEADVSSKSRIFLEKSFGKLEVQEGSFVHVGMELAQEKDPSATSTRADFTKHMELLPTPPSLWARGKELLSRDYVKLRQCKLGELRRVATVSRPDICARLARIASKINAPCGSDVYRINGMVRAARDWQQATALKYASPSHPRRALGWGDEGQGAAQNRGGRVRCGSMTLVRWSDAANKGQLTEGKCRLGSAIGLTSSTLHTFRSGNPILPEK